MLLRRSATFSALVSLFAVVLAGTVWVLHPERTRPEHRSGSAQVGTPATERAAAGGTPGPRTARPDRAGPEVRARRVLQGWDDRRAAAWEDADERALRALYVPGSRTGEQDVRMLRRWTRRGLRVDGLRTELDEVRVLRRGPDRWVLEVTDRTSGSAVLGESGSLLLPQDGWSTRQVVLRHGVAGWRVAEVRESAGS